jgi:hypothetical protein
MAPRRVSIAEANSGGRNKKNLSIQGGYEKSTNGQADVLAFGPIVELASGKLLVTRSILSSPAKTGFRVAVDTGPI